MDVFGYVAALPTSLYSNFSARCIGAGSCGCGCGGCCCLWSERLMQYFCKLCNVFSSSKCSCVPVFTLLSPASPLLNAVLHVLQAPHTLTEGSFKKVHALHDHCCTTTGHFGFVMRGVVHATHLDCTSAFSSVHTGHFHFAVNLPVTVVLVLALAAEVTKRMLCDSEGCALLLRHITHLLAKGLFK